MQKIIFLLLLCCSFSTQAACPLADRFFKKGKPAAAVGFLQSCAINYNDDESQMKLAHAFTKGLYGLGKDNRKTLYFYQLAAEAGNAEAQLALAEAFMQADKTSESRDELLDYRTKIQTVQSNPEKGTFNGDFLHPYALLLLASESPDKKWFYPSLVRQAPPKTAALLKTYKIDDDKKRLAMRQASQFKTRKILQIAKEVLPEDEYQEMESQLKNQQTQAQALATLKQKMDAYIQRKKEIRKTK